MLRELVAYPNYTRSISCANQKLHAPATMKKSPPRTSANVVPTEPETGIALVVEGIALRVAPPLSALVVAVAEAVAVADWLPTGTGLLELYG